MYYAYKLNKQGDNIQPCLYSFPNLEPVSYSLSGSNCCFLTHIQVFQETSKVVWHSHLFKYFPVYCDPQSQRLQCSQWSRSRFFLEVPRFLNDPTNVGDLISVFSASSKLAGSSQFKHCWSRAWRILSITLLSCEMNTIVHSLNMLWHCPSLGLKWKLTSSSPAEFSKFAGMLSASSFKILNSSAEILSPPLALFVVMLPKAHFTLQDAQL